MRCNRRRDERGNRQTAQAALVAAGGSGKEGEGRVKGGLLMGLTEPMEEAFGATDNGRGSLAKLRASPNLLLSRCHLPGPAPNLLLLRRFLPLQRSFPHPSSLHPSHQRTAPSFPHPLSLAPRLLFLPAHRYARLYHCFLFPSVLPSPSPPALHRSCFSYTHVFPTALHDPRHSARASLRPNFGPQTSAPMVAVHGPAHALSLPLPFPPPPILPPSHHDLHTAPASTALISGP
ncbi:unnamed protein product [Closterium sp. Naga37s-1]|nr:unnamed protein product [Closterium sp. Naga37s-1]